jgi:putative Mg2+ transporter-C (MgtC) family protein
MLSMFGGGLEVALRLGAAVLVGGGIGLERELHGKPAGIRTNALVGLGSALAVLVIIRATPAGFNSVDALSHVIQGVIAGVGFLGGGAILKSTGSLPESVHGLTTAASIWLVAALGIACGVGQWETALIAAAIALFVLVLLIPVERRLRRHIKTPRG